MTMLEDILLEVRKPGRYIGMEWNAVKKDFAAQEVKFAVCFPDLYEVGMSHLGLRIIYGLLNELEGVVCERVFLPDFDMQAVMRREGMPLFSLESRRPLADFDFLGFCLNYELDYTNVLASLDLAGIPLLSSDRGQRMPIIIAGGTCSSNPEPLADFIDLFFVGEAEEALPEMMGIYRKLKAASAGRSLSRESVLCELAKVEGVYVPSFYEAEYGDSGLIKPLSTNRSGVPGRVKKRIVKNINDVYYPTSWLVPYIGIIHDRASVELMRGCPHRCSFCQARSIYHNVRLRSPERVLELAEKICRSSGYEEVSLLSLSSSNYPHLASVVGSLSGKFQEQAISLSLPSIRPMTYLTDLPEHMAKVRKSTLTFAPESGTHKMRSALNKDFDIEELYSTVSSAYKAGWQSVKLYFMIGLPEEDVSDLDGILEIARNVSEARRAVAGFPAEVRASISFFIPKPHTGLEREAMESMEVLREKVQYLKKKSGSVSRRIKLNFHSLEMSFVEAVFSRGDRRLGKVLLSAYRRGCMLDGWSEHFKFNSWLEAFNASGVGTGYYLEAKALDEILPWQHIDLSGV